MQQQKRQKTDNSYNDFTEVLEAVGRDNVVIDRAQLIASTKSVPKNRFRTKIQGFVIQDTVNNPLFPINQPILDKGKGYIGKIFKQYMAKYQKQYSNNTFPWHYIVEFNRQQGFYVVHNTRPINLKFPYSRDDINKSIEVNDTVVNDKTREFLDIQNLETDQMIHICIVGDSGLDVYTKDLYDKIGTYIIGPLSKIHKIPPILDNGIYFMNMGKKFKTNMLKTHIKKL